MIEQKDLAGTFTLPGKSMTLNRMGYGAMQLAGPGFVQTNLATSMTDPGGKAQIVERMEKMAIPPAAIARAIAFAIEQPSEVECKRDRNPSHRTGVAESFFGANAMRLFGGCTR